MGENVTGYRYIAHLYCLAVQAGFYSDVVECSLSTRENLVRSPSGKKEFFFACYTCTRIMVYSTKLASCTNIIINISIKITTCKCKDKLYNRVTMDGVQCYMYLGKVFTLFAYKGKQKRKTEIATIEPPHQKTNYLHMRKQRCKSAAE